MDDKTFTNKEIAKITGLAPRAVLFYNDLVPATEGTGVGRGNPRRYDREALFKFLIIKQLAEHGITIGRMASLLQIADWNRVIEHLNSGTGKMVLRSQLVITKKLNGTTYEDMEFSAQPGSWQAMANTTIEMLDSVSALVINVNILAHVAMRA